MGERRKRDGQRALTNEFERGVLVTGETMEIGWSEALDECVASTAQLRDEGSRILTGITPRAAAPTEAKIIAGHGKNLGKKGWRAGRGTGNRPIDGVNTSTLWERIKGISIAGLQAVTLMPLHDKGRAALDRQWA